MAKMKLIIFIFIILISFNLFSIKKIFLKTYCEKVFLAIEKKSNYVFPKKLLSKFTYKIENIFPFEKKEALLKALKTNIKISDIQDYAEYEPETKTLFFRPDVVKSLFFPLIYSHELRHVIDEITGRINYTRPFSFFKKIFNLKVESTLNSQVKLGTDQKLKVGDGSKTNIKVNTCVSRQKSNNHFLFTYIFIFLFE